MACGAAPPAGWWCALGFSWNGKACRRDGSILPAAFRSQAKTPEDRFDGYIKAAL
jgi:hypothetical protein